MADPTGKVWRGQDAAIAVKESDGTSIPVGVLDDPEVSAPEQEVQELDGAGSTEWFDVQKTSTRPTVSGTVASWDIDAWDTLIDYDAANSKLDDSAEVATFEVVVTFTASDGSTKDVTADPAYVDGAIPLGGGTDDWIGMDLQFVAQTLSISNTDASA